MNDVKIEKINLQQKLGLVNQYWTPKIIGELNGQYVKIAKFKGEFVKHKHENEDEMFYVVKGKLCVQFEDYYITVNSGEFIIVPRGVSHKPYAEQEVEILLFEPITTLNTGNVKNDLTISNLQKI